MQKFDSIIDTAHDSVADGFFCADDVVEELREAGASREECEDALLALSNHLQQTADQWTDAVNETDANIERLDEFYEADPQEIIALRREVAVLKRQLEDATKIIGADLARSHANVAQISANP